MILICIDNSKNIKISIKDVPKWYGTVLQALDWILVEAGNLDFICLITFTADLLSWHLDAEYHLPVPTVEYFYIVFLIVAAVWWKNISWK